jgi:hypothetical protein
MKKTFPQTSGVTTRAALMGGVAVGAALAMTAVMAPTQAIAANECGAPAAGVVHCTPAGNPYAGGITYTPAADLTVVVDPTVVENSAGNGVTITPTAFNSTIVASAGSQVTAAGTGLSVTTTGANASATNGGTLVAGVNGVYAVVASGAGNATARNDGTVTINTAVYGATGVYASTQNGNVSAINTGTIKVGGTSNYVQGIYANAGSPTAANGVATITNSGSITATTSGTRAVGINAYAQNGIVINGGGNITVQQTQPFTGALHPAFYYTAIGIQARDLSGGGPVTIVAGDVTANGYSAQGIVVQTNGTTNPINVTFHNIIANVSGATVGGDGVNLWDIGGAPVNVTGNSVVTTGNFNDGVRVGGRQLVGSAGDTTVNVNTITTAGTTSDGVIVRGAGNFGVTVGSVGTTGDTSDGVLLISSAGNIVAKAGAIVAGAPTGGVTTTGVNSNAIDATTAGAGTIAITNAGATSTSGAGSVGMRASGVDGAVGVTNTGSISTTNTTGGVEYGVYASTSGKGSITIINSGSVKTAANEATALYAHAAGIGGASVTNSGAITTAGNDAYGVYAHTVSGAASATNAVGGVIKTTGSFGYGVYARSESGTASGTNAGTISTTGANADGIRVRTFTTGAATASNTGSITTTNTNSKGVDVRSTGGTVTITGGGTVTTSGTGSTGVYGQGVAGVSITASGTTTVSGAGTEGILGTSTAGPVTISAGSVNVTGTGAGSNAVHATSGGAASVTTTAGTVHSTNGQGILVTGGTTGAVTVGAGSTVEGVNGVNITSATGTTISNSGTIRPLNTTTGFSITAGGAGAATVTNNSGGTITGAMSLTAQNDVFNNVGTFNNTALTSFGAGADVVNNGGPFNAMANVDFGTGADVFNNTAGGRVNVAPGSASATTITFLGLETFNNAGSINMVNGHAGDIFALPGTAFTGSGSSGLSLEFNPGAGAADQLQVGTAGGVTSITATRIGTSFGTLGQSLPVVVIASGATASTAFNLNGGVVDGGFINYNLQFNSATNTFSLVGGPSAEAFEVGRLGLAAQQFWSNTADVWSARTQEMRDSMWTGNPTRGEGWEMWAQAHAGNHNVESSRTITAFGTTTTNNLGIDSDWRGFQMGADKVSGSMMWGITGGFAQQESRLHFDHNSFDLQGWNLGAYAGFTSGHFFLNGLVKGDWYEVAANLHTVPAYDRFNGHTYGVAGETGFRFGGPSFFVEPILSADYASTHLDGFTAAGMTFGFGDSNRWTGKAGARFGAEWGSIIPYVGIYAADSWGGKNNTTFTTGASSLTFADVSEGSHGLVDFGFTTKSWNGLEGFLKGEDSFSGKSTGFVGRLGVRWRW